MLRLPTKVWGSIGTALLSAGVVFGCTAVEGADPIGDSNRTARALGFVSALFVIGTIVFYFLRGRKGRWAIILSAILFVIHPAWTVSAWIGDCGTAKVDHSKWFTGFLLSLTLYQGFRWLLTKRNGDLSSRENWSPR
ncbi:MAG TPA: hypothetical protein DEP46_06115 [Blastocatellia bacterium]|nr:hypothetical protein [Blastocatellia bacterium]